jgi:hypothetical protein
MPDAGRDFESQLEREYDSFLIRERGLAATTRARYLAEVRRFLGQGSGKCSANQGSHRGRGGLGVPDKRSP